MKLIIAGSRKFTNFNLLQVEVERFLASNLKAGEPIEVVCGGASGADTLGKIFAEEHGIRVVSFYPMWYKDGVKDASAGHKRNADMAEYATHCIVFWDGASPGTKSMIRLAKHKGMNVKVVKYTANKPVSKDFWD